jgi:hypothetical protein
LPDGTVLTLNTSGSQASIIGLANGNKQLFVREGHKEARIELTPEAAQFLANRLTASGDA